MTYNVHSFVGTDHVYDPERVARVIALGAPDLVALQEVDFGRGAAQGQPAIERVAERLGMTCHFTYTREGSRGRFGNAVLSAHPFQLVAEGMLPRRRDEARAVQWLRVIARGFEMQLMNTHLSVSFRERRAQVQALLGAEWAVQAMQGLPLVICGDLNASPWSAVYRDLSRDLHDVQRGQPRTCATWPSRLPFWRIDHMFVSKHIRVSSVDVIAQALSRVASDHLPLVAELSLAQETA